MATQLAGIDRVELGDQPDPAPAAGQALIRVHGAGIGPWDVGFLGGGFPGLTLPFVPGQEVAGVVEAAGDGAGVQTGDRVYASLFPAGGGFAELAPRDQAIGAVRDGGRAMFIVLQGPEAPLERGIMGESFAAHVDRERLEGLGRLVEAGALRPQVGAVLPLEQAREALTRVAGRHARGKIVLQIGP